MRFFSKKFLRFIINCKICPHIYLILLKNNVKNFDVNKKINHIQILNNWSEEKQIIHSSIPKTKKIKTTRKRGRKHKKDKIIKSAKQLSPSDTYIYGIYVENEELFLKGINCIKYEEKYESSLRIFLNNIKSYMEELSPLKKKIKKKRDCEIKGLEVSGIQIYYIFNFTYSF